MLNLPLCSNVLTIDHVKSHLRGPLPNRAIMVLELIFQSFRCVRGKDKRMTITAAKEVLLIEEQGLAAVR